jgi:hypothetical protein
MLLDNRLGGSTRHHFDQYPPRDWEMRVPDDVLNSVVFIGRDCNGRTRWTSTGFLVAVPHGTNLAAGYLVATRHSALKLDGLPFVLRFNRESGPPVELPVPNDAKWWYHPTEPEAVDAAVLSISPPEETNYRAVSVANFLTDAVIAEQNIGPGDEVVCPGLFTKHTGTDRSYPILRTGTVAMMPAEPLPSVTIGDYTGPASAYLVESRSLGGLSGSPVWVRQTIHLPVTPARPGGGEVVRMQGPGPMYLMGLMHGHWTVKPEDANRYDFAPDRSPEPLALGISVVVPAKKIREVLDHPELVARRADAAREEARRNAPTPT